MVVKLMDGLKILLNSSAFHLKNLYAYETLSGPEEDSKGLRLCQSGPGDFDVSSNISE